MSSGPADGPDPWCTWCDADVTAPPAFMIEGEDDGRWPPMFCSEACARKWGNAVHQDRVYRVDEAHQRELLEWVAENTDTPTILDNESGPSTTETAQDGGRDE